MPEKTLSSRFYARFMMCRFGAYCSAGFPEVNFAPGFGATLDALYIN